MLASLRILPVCEVVRSGVAMAGEKPTEGAERLVRAGASTEGMRDGCCR